MDRKGNKRLDDICVPPSKEEIRERIEKLIREINEQGKDWDAAFLVGRINQYYLTGTMQDGVLVIKKDGSHAYFARRSYERAKMESLVENVHPMVSYRDVFAAIGGDVRNIYIETETVTYGMLQRLKKYCDIGDVYSIDRILLKIRAVKSPYELSIMEESGRRHDEFLTRVVPGLLEEGMNEAGLTACLFKEMVEMGYHGVARFAMFQNETVVGQLGFGENSLHPTSFDGPGGMKGLYPAVPIIGDRNRLLKKGDLVFIDIGFGINGYHTDKTQIYMFGKEPSEEVQRIHRECLRIQKRLASSLKDGSVPSEIYSGVMESLSEEFKQNFMGFGNRSVKFLGHGVGLQIDEAPIIAYGFNEPLRENMTIALEPKKGLEGVGLVGVEDTYVVTKDGGRCITGGGRDIIVV